MARSGVNLKKRCRINSLTVAGAAPEWSEDNSVGAAFSGAALFLRGHRLPEHLTAAAL